MCAVYLLHLLVPGSAYSLKWVDWDLEDLANGTNTVLSASGQGLYTCAGTFGHFVELRQNASLPLPVPIMGL